jgi:hypothetical protein
MKPKFLISSLLAAMVLSSQGAVLALYNFDSEALTSSDTESSSTASDLGVAVAGSLTGNTAQNNAGLQIHDQHTDRQSTSDSLTFAAPVSGFALVGQYGDIDRSTNLQAAIDNDIYVSFTLTPGVNTTIDVTAFRMDMGITNGTAAKTVGIFSSIGGFASASDAIGTRNWTGTPGGTDSGMIDLSSLGTITTATDFRVYIITGASTTSHGFALDNITLEGTVTAIPEPSAALLGGLGLLALLRRRRV